MAPAIHQTTSYVFEDADTAASRYALEDDGYIYSRIANPTVTTLEDRLAALEGGAGAVATGSGMAALDSATLVLAEAGDTVVCSTDTYGGTSTYFSKTASRRNIETTFVPTLEYDAYEDAIDEDTAFVHVETIGNPSLVTPDFERLSEIAHENGVPLVVDNTFATPALCRPLEHGADVVWESTTKWLHGSGTTVGGVLVDGGTFPGASTATTKSPDRTTPITTSTSRVTFPTRPSPRPSATARSGVWATSSHPSTPGRPCRGSSRFRCGSKHCENAAIVADYLADHDDVAWVTYPGLDSHTTHDNASQYLADYGGMVAFGLDGGYEAGKRFCENVDLAQFLANIGDAKTLVIHPASTTHGQLSPKNRRRRA